MKLTKKRFEALKKEAKKRGPCSMEWDEMNGLSVKEFEAHRCYKDWMFWFYDHCRNGGWGTSSADPKLFPEGEDVILTSSYDSSMYAIKALKKRWGKYEKVCLKQINRDAKSSYYLEDWDDYLKHFDLELVDA